jgi:hypothetical protein
MICRRLAAVCGYCESGETFCEKSTALSRFAENGLQPPNSITFMHSTRSFPARHHERSRRGKPGRSQSAFTHRHQALKNLLAWLDGKPQHTL